MLQMDVVKDDPQAVTSSSATSPVLYQWEVARRGGCPTCTNGDTLQALKKDEDG